MTDRWFYVSGGETVGPISTADLIAYLTSRSDWRSVHIWQDGFSEWKTAGDVSEIAPLISRPPPPPPETPQTEITKPEKKLPKAKAFTFVALAIAAIVGGVIGRPIGKEVANAITAPSSPQSQSAAVAEGLAKAVSQVKPTLPNKIDDMTTMIGISAVGTRLTYLYYLDTKKFKVGASFENDIRDHVVPKVCGEQKTKQALNYGATYEYSYVDVESKPLGTVVVSSKDCKS